MKKLPFWAIPRARLLHRVFSNVAARLEGTKIPLIPTLAVVAKGLQGVVVEVGEGQSFPLKCSRSTLVREWYNWKNGRFPAEAMRCEGALMPSYNGHALPLPESIRVEVRQRYSAAIAESGWSLGLARKVSLALRTDFNQRRPLPGIDYRDFPSRPFPWSHAQMLACLRDLRAEALGDIRRKRLLVRSRQELPPALLKHFLRLALQEAKGNRNIPVALRRAHELLTQAFDRKEPLPGVDYGRLPHAKLPWSLPLMFDKARQSAPRLFDPRLQQGLIGLPSIRD